MSKDKQAIVLVRGGGDLATGVALRLHRAGVKVLITELAQPLAVRRMVSFSEAVYEGLHTVEGVTAQLVSWEQLEAGIDANEIPVIVDPDAGILTSGLHDFIAVVDASLIKSTPQPLAASIPLLIGLGPGFHAGRNCHAVIETRRSHTLGRVYWEGPTQPDSGEPEGDPRRVLRAPSNGVLIARALIGDHVEEGQVVAVISNESLVSSGGYLVVSPFKGVLRGLIRPGLQVTRGIKVGDVDVRDDPSACYLVSDKSLAIGGGVLEAILTREEIRRRIYSN